MKRGGTWRIQELPDTIGILRSALVDSDERTWMTSYSTERRGTLWYIDEDGRWLDVGMPKGDVIDIQIDTSEMWDTPKHVYGTDWRFEKNAVEARGNASPRPRPQVP